MEISQEPKTFKQSRYEVKEVLGRGLFSSVGSGSLQTVRFGVEVVADQEQVQTNQVHLFELGERQGFPDKAG